MFEAYVDRSANLLDLATQQQQTSERKDLSSIEIDKY